MSILTPVFDPPARVFAACIASVLGQRSPHWEWCIVDDASCGTDVRAQLAALTAAEPRVRVRHRATNGGIVAATNDALDLATGRIVTFLDHDDELLPDAIEVLLAAFEAEPDVGIVYSDEELIDATGTPVAVYDKPDFSPERLRGHNYFCHSVGVDRSWLQATGGLDPRFEGAQDYELNLRAVEHFGGARHVPRRLYRWRAIKGSVAADPEAKPSTLISAERAVREHCARTGLDVGVTPVRDAAFAFRLRRSPACAPLVSLVVRQLDGALPPLIGEVLREAQWSNVELVVVREDLPSLQAVDDAVARANGEVLLIVDGELRLHHGNLLGELLPLAQEPDVGAVGPLLHLPDGRLGASGVSLHDTPHSVGFGFPSDAVGAWAAFCVTREVSAIPAVCFAARRGVFDELGGLQPAPSPHLAGADFGRRALDAGLRVLVTPHAGITLADAEDVAAPSDEERRAWEERWGAAGADERYSLFERPAQRVAGTLEPA